MEKPNNITSLFERYLRNEATPAEIEQLYAYFQQPENEEVLTAHILRALDRTDQMDPQLLARLQTMTDRLEEHLLSQVTTTRWIRPWMAYAASVLLLCVTGWVIVQFFQQENPAVSPVTGALSDVHDPAGLAALEPGINRATLSLADGRIIPLNETEAGISMDAEGIVYLDAGTPVVGWDRPQAAEMQTLSTPPGGMYLVVLSDSTKVWLNAASSLRFPAHFTGSDRVVELEGEGYFEVASGGNGQRFLVKTSSHTIEVTGTQFNVKAYADEPDAQTALIEGGIRIHSIGQQATDNQTQTLRPGELATVHGDRIRIEQVDTGPYTAWRDGRFSFEGKTLEQVGREIGRWYDIEIQYEDTPPPGMKLFGDAHRDQDITFFIKLLESGGFDHHFSGRTLIIKRKEGTAQQ